MLGVAPHLLGRRATAALVVVAAGLGVASMAQTSSSEHALPSLVAWVRGARFVEARNVVRQRRANDCGPAALAEGLRRLGLDAPYPGPAERIVLGPRGCALQDLAEEAFRYGAVAKVRRLAPREVGEVAPPAILHLTEGHFVVLEGRTADGNFLIADPSLGRLEQPPSSLVRHWSGYALELRLPERQDSGLP